MNAIATNWGVNTLTSLRSIFEPLFIFHQLGPYKDIKGEALRRILLYWRDPSIDAIVYALDSFYELGSKEQVLKITQRDHQRELVKFLADNFVNLGEYKAFRQSTKAPPTAYASWMSIRLFRYIDEFDLTYYAHSVNPLGYEKAIELQKLLAEVDLRLDGFVDEIINFTLKSQDTATGGFFDSPLDKSSRQANVVTTHSAYMLLWNLKRTDSVGQQVRIFLLEKCLKKEKIKGVEAIGFSDLPEGSIEINATYYALRILQKLGEQEWIENNKPKIIEFLKACWVKETGGFRADLTSSEADHQTLVSTSHALEIFFDVLDEPEFLLESEHLEKIHGYIKMCQSQHYGGFRFDFRQLGSGSSERVSFFSPNLYMTRHIIRIAKLLQENIADDTVSLRGLLDNRVNEFLNDPNIRIKEWQFVSYRLHPSWLIKLVRLTADFFLKPSNPLKRPLVSIKPIPYIVASIIFLSIFLLLLISGVLTSPTVLALLAGPIAFGIVIVIETSLWLFTK